MLRIKLDIELNKVQKDILNLVDNNFISIALCSRQIGKSTLAKYLTINWLLETNKDIGYITPTLKLAKKFYQDLIDILPPSLLRISNGTDLVIKCITGSTLSFSSAEQANKIRGNTYNYLLLDEFAFMKDSSKLWNGILKPTIKNKGEKVLFISTPNGKNYFYELTKIYPTIKRTIYDDPFIKDISKIRNETPEYLFKQEYLCEFIEGNESIFTNFQCSSTNLMSPLYCGIDFSSIGKDETILTYIDKSYNVEQELITGQIDEKYSKIVESFKSRKPIYILGEKNSIGEVMINDINKLSKYQIHRFLTTKDSKGALVKRLAILLERNQIKHNSKELESQLASFGYQLKGLHNSKDDRVMSLLFAIKALEDNTKSIKPIFI